MKRACLRAVAMGAVLSMGMTVSGLSAAGAGNLPQSSLSMEIKAGAAVVKNTGSLPAVGLNISQPGHLDPFTMEDNYFWLDAGETKTVKVSDTKGLVLDGWNIGKP